MSTNQLNLIQKILIIKANNNSQPLFELPFTDDPSVVHYVDEFYKRMVCEKRTDVPEEKQANKTSKDGKYLQIKDINSIRNKDVREIGAEWMLYKALCQLQFAPFLASRGWGQERDKTCPEPCYQ